jgi:hypothetical protein
MTDYTDSIDPLHAASQAPMSGVDETLEAAQDSARTSERHHSAVAELMQSLCLKLIDMTEANANAVFELARQLVKARSPGEIVESCAAHVHKQFELFNAQTRELVEQAQGFSDQAAPPRAHSVH